MNTAIPGRCRKKRGHVDPAIAECVRSSLPTGDYELVCASSVKEGLAALPGTRPDIVIVSLLLPDGSGWDVLAALRGDPDLARLPIVVFTGPLATERGGPRSIRAR